jgi:hypothetical protein
LIVVGGDYGALSTLIAQAYDFSAWDGNGLLTSSADAAAGLTTLAIAPARCDRLRRRLVRRASRSPRVTFWSCIRTRAT